jgi:hypothetical protein
MTQPNTASDWPPAFTDQKLQKIIQPNTASDWPPAFSDQKLQKITQPNTASDWPPAFSEWIGGQPTLCEAVGNKAEITLGANLEKENTYSILLFKILIT